MFLVISSSLHPESRSRILANYAFKAIEKSGEEVEFLDLAEIDLPRCDGGQCYADENAILVTNKIREAKGVLLAVPIYNYQAGSSAKNLLELSGKAWEDTVVGFLCAAGGRGSYMGIMSMANSLMLDFRTFVLPQYIYTTGEEVSGSHIDGEIELRLERLSSQLVSVTNKLNSTS